MIGRSSILLLGHLLLWSGVNPQPAHADSTLPGRLFFSPAERLTLEHAHQHSAPDNTGTADPPREVIRFDGMVWREEQLVALWINHKHSAVDRHLRPDPDTGQLHVTDQSGQLVKLHAGQQWPPSIIDDSSQSVRIERHRGDAGQ